MATTNNAPPPNWGSDEITKFFDASRHNQYATFHNKDAFALLKRIDSCFRKVLEKPINPRPYFPLQFLYRSHSAFLAACTLAMAGQTVEVYVMLRLSLESAAYGFYINDDKARAIIWLNRHDGIKDKNTQRSEFQHAKVEKHINSSAQKLGSIFALLYDRTIDYGAHPNERGFLSNTKVVESEDSKEFLQIYLQDDGPQLDLALKTAVQAGIWALSIFQMIYPAKWELLSIKHELVELWKHC